MEKYVYNGDVVDAIQWVVNNVEEALLFLEKYKITDILSVKQITVSHILLTYKDGSLFLSFGDWLIIDKNGFYWKASDTTFGRFYKKVSE